MKTRPYNYNFIHTRAATCYNSALMRPSLSKSILLRSTGALLLLAALAGWLLSLGGLAVLWSTRPQVTKGLSDLLTIGSDTLDATAATLDVVETSLIQSADTFVVLNSTLDSAASTLGTASDIVDDIGGLVGEDLVAVVDQTQVSLTSASDSAKLVDDTLRLVSSLPLVGQRYQPEVPLSESITDIATSLEGMNTSLGQIQDGLDKSGKEVNEFHWMMVGLSGQIEQITPQLYAALQQVGAYRAIVADLQQKVTSFQQALPGYLTTVYILLTILLLWVALSQLGLFMQGLQLFAPKRLLPHEPDRENPVA